MPDQSSLVHRWETLTQDNPMPLLSRKRVIGENMMLSHITLAKGCHVPSHSHANEQFAVILSGRLKFGLGAPGTSDYREVTVSAGEVLHLPPNLPHSAHALEDTLALDIFSPPSQKTGIDRA